MELRSSLRNCDLNGPGDLSLVSRISDCRVPLSFGTESVHTIGG
jgi:hypothetical protein